MCGSPIEPAAWPPTAATLLRCSSVLASASITPSVTGARIFFDPCPKPVDCFNALLVFGKQAVAAHLDNAQPASVFRCHIEHRLHRQAQRSLKKRKRIQQPFAAARCALAHDMRVQCVTAPCADRDRMKQLVPIAQASTTRYSDREHEHPGVPLPTTGAVVRPAQALVDPAQLKCAGRGLQFSLIIDQIAACDARRQMTHEYHRQARIDLGFQTRANALVAARTVSRCLHPAMR